MRAKGDCTENPVSDIAATKTVDRNGQVKLDPGDRLTYTLKFTNKGDGPGVVNYIDHLGDVFDDAVWVSGPNSSDPALDAVRKGKQILMTGTLPAGEPVTVTYAVRVKPNGNRGNDQLLNYLNPDGTVSPTNCDQDRDDCTFNDISPTQDNNTPPTDPGGELPDTGSPVNPWVLGGGLLFVLIGVGLVVAGRRGREEASGA